MKQVRVEFFGIPRSRAGVAETLAAADSLGELVLDLSRRFPQLGESCFDGPRFRPGYTANLSGDRFTTDPVTPLRDNESVLILSLDAGGQSIFAMVMPWCSRALVECGGLFCRA